MAIKVEVPLFTEEKVGAHSNIKMLDSMVETLVTEFNQHKHEECLSSSSTVSKLT